MRIKLQAGLLPLNISVVLLILVITFVPSTPLRIILGLPFLLFFPGYVLITALFPRKNQLGPVERVAFTLGFSVAIVSLTGLILNYTPWGIGLYPTLVSVSAFIAGMSLVTWYQQRRLAKAERFTVSLDLGALFKRETGIDRRLSVLLAIIVLVAVGTFIFAVASPRIGERFTELYILGPGGTAQDYPRQLEVGEEAKVIVGIINREHETVSYRLTVTVDGAEQTEISPVVLDHDAKWEGAVSFSFSRPGDNLKVAFLLYREGGTEPHLDPVYLRVNVREKA